MENINCKSDRAIVTVTGPIEESSMLQLASSIQKLHYDLYYKNIELEISSPGGLIQALDYIREIMEGLRAKGVTFTTRALISTSSAAANLVSLGDYRQAARTTSFLYHQSRGGGADLYTAKQATVMVSAMEQLDERYLNLLVEQAQRQAQSSQVRRPALTKIDFADNDWSIIDYLLIASGNTKSKGTEGYRDEMLERLRNHMDECLKEDEKFKQLYRSLFDLDRFISAALAVELHLVDGFVDDSLKPESHDSGSHIPESGVPEELYVPEWKSLYPEGRISRKLLCRHTLILGETGSGKSASGILPIVRSVMADNSPVGCALIIDPKGEIRAEMEDMPHNSFKIHDIDVKYDKRCVLNLMAGEKEFGEQDLKDHQYLKMATEILKRSASLSTVSPATTLAGQRHRVSGDPFWDVQGTDLAQTVLAFVLLMLHNRRDVFVSYNTFVNSDDSSVDVDEEAMKRKALAEKQKQRIRKDNPVFDTEEELNDFVRNLYATKNPTKDEQELIDENKKACKEAADAINLNFGDTTAPGRTTDAPRPDEDIVNSDELRGAHRKLMEFGAAAGVVAADVDILLNPEEQRFLQECKTKVKESLDGKLGVSAELGGWFGWDDFQPEEIDQIREEYKQVYALYSELIPKFVNVIKGSELYRKNYEFKKYFDKSPVNSDTFTKFWLKPIPIKQILDKSPMSFDTSADIPAVEGGPSHEQDNTIIIGEIVEHPVTPYAVLYDYKGEPIAEIPPEHLTFDPDATFLGSVTEEAVTLVDSKGEKVAEFPREVDKYDPDAIVAGDFTEDTVTLIEAGSGKKVEEISREVYELNNAGIDSLIYRVQEIKTDLEAIFDYTFNMYSSFEKEENIQPSQNILALSNLALGTMFEPGRDTISAALIVEQLKDKIKDGEATEIYRQIRGWDDVSRAEKQMVGVVSAAKNCFFGFRDGTPANTLYFGVEPYYQSVINHDERDDWLVLDFNNAVNEDKARSIYVFQPDRNNNGALVARALKAAWFEAVLSSKKREKDGGSMPLVAYIADEFHQFITTDKVHGEQSFLDTCRSFGAFCVLACQSISSMKHALAEISGDVVKDQEGISVLLSNTATKLFFRTTDTALKDYMDRLCPFVPGLGQVTSIRPPSTLQPGECYASLANGSFERRQLEPYTKEKGRTAE